MSTRAYAPCSGQGLDSTGSGPFHFRGFSVPDHRAPRDFMLRLLETSGVARVELLLQGPQLPCYLDRRLINLGLALQRLGKTVATPTAKRCLYQPRFAVLQGFGDGSAQPVGELEAEDMRAAVYIIREVIFSRLDAHLRSRLSETGNELFRRLRIPPIRTWPCCTGFQFVIEISRLDEISNDAATPNYQSFS